MFIKYKASYKVAQGSLAAKAQLIQHLPLTPFLSPIQHRVRLRTTLVKKRYNQIHDTGKLINPFCRGPYL